jgi:ATP-dependent DNA helicase 2 subunit 1
MEPPGFQIIFLPFADDIRQVTEQYYDREQANEEQTAAAVEMIHSAKIPGFSASTFENPRLAKHYACVQALALFKDETGFNEEEDDVVKPDVEGQAIITEPSVAMFVETLPEYSEPAKKGSSGSSKRKAKEPLIDLKEAKQMKMDFETIYRDGLVKKQTVARLKAFLKSQGLPCTGKKQDLIDKVNACYDEK